MSTPASEQPVNTTALEKFYYTFAPDFRPYRNGWVIINAPNITTANALFRLLFPHPTYQDCLNCCSVYTEKQFEQTCMFQLDDNCGRGLIAEFSINLDHGEYNNPETDIHFPNDNT